MPKDDDDLFASPDKLRVFRNPTTSDRRDAEKPRRFWAVALTSCAVAALVVVLWAAGGSEDENGPLPVVVADTSDYKTRPENAGGMDIAYKDSTVYETYDAESRTRRTQVENLLTDMEEPLPRETVFAGIKPQPERVEKVTESNIKPVIIKTNREGKNISETPDESVLDEAPLPDPEDRAELNTKIEEVFNPQPRVQITATLPEDPIEDDTAVAEEVQKAEPAAAAVSAAPEAIDGAQRYVQLASLKDRAAAEKAWALSVKEYSVLAGVDHRISEVEIDGRGTFYRVQAGPVAEARAKSLCDQISAQKSGACLVVKP